MWATHDVKMVTGFHWTLASRLEIQHEIFKFRETKSLEVGRSIGGNKATYPKGVATWPPVWKFADRYSIPSLVIVFTPRNGVGIENRASQWGEKANVRVFQYCI
jgi:hypothetical protein